MSEARGSVSVIIPNWNGLRYLQTCLDAVLQQTYPSFEVVLVDNGSTDGSCEFVAREYPQVRLLRSDRNLGFAGGTNLAIRYTDSDYVATLNSDTEAEPTWLEELVKAIDSHPRAGTPPRARAVGMCASKMLFYDQRQVINSAGIAVDRAGIAWDRDGGMLDRPSETQPSEVFGPCAGAALYRRAMLDEIGLFDESYSSYLEDVDLAWRGQGAGWRCLYVPTARVYHVHSGAGLQGSALKSYLLGRNKLATIIKNYPLPHLLWYLPLILLYDWLSVLYKLGRYGDWHALRGRIAALRRLPGLLRQRRQIQQRRVISSQAMMDLLHPLQTPQQVLERYIHLG